MKLDESDFSRDAECIMCPFCWPDDAGLLNVRLRVFVCSHCGTIEDFRKFIQSVKVARNSRARRLKEDDKLIAVISDALNADATRQEQSL